MIRNIKKRLFFTIPALIIASSLVYIHYMHKTTTICFIESNAIQEVLQQVKSKNILCIFDIDNTLAWPAQELGSDPWVTQIIKNKTATGTAIDTAYDQFLPLYFHVHDFIDMHPVEPDTLSVLEQLRSRGIHFIALTTRNVSIINRTHEQLEKAEIRFNPPNEPISFLSFEHMQYPAILSDGILFCGSNNKGIVLEKYFQICKIPKPDCIIYIDDKRTYLDQVAHYCKANSIDFVGIRYGYLDSFVKNFDFKKAQDQLETFLKEHPFDSPTHSYEACIC